MTEHRGHVLKALDEAAGLCRTTRVAGFDVDVLGFIKDQVDRQVSQQKDQLEALIDSFNDECQAAKRDIDRSIIRGIRNLSGYPDYMRAQERLAAYIEVKQWLELLDR